MNLLALAVTLFLVLDPFGNAAIFHAILAKVPTERRPRVLLRELCFALVILLGFLFVGKYLLGFLGVKQATLSISGGILLFLIALGMVFPTRSVLGESADEEPFIVPLAVPLMAGPSSIALILLTASKYPQEIPSIALAVSGAWLVSAVILYFSPALLRLLGSKGTRALERLMGLLLILVAVQMFLDGVANYSASSAP
ncbi:MarC family protein [Haloferula sp. BvORR071]|uniref:MarC family protein n=1 Tax=Haloferula sp. BvORR071 TaxID=1396141 RepID=UPI000552FB81|nr:MarC family protein [Haloferula sp. BvORR071]